MEDKPKFDENKYRQQYKKEHFDHIGFFAPKGLKAKVQAKAEKEGLSLSKYIIRLLEEDTQ